MSLLGPYTHWCISQCEACQVHWTMRAVANRRVSQYSHDQHAAHLLSTSLLVALRTQRCQTSGTLERTLPIQILYVRLTALGFHIVEACQSSRVGTHPQAVYYARYAAAVGVPAQGCTLFALAATLEGTRPAAGRRADASRAEVLCNEIACMVAPFMLCLESTYDPSFAAMEYADSKSLLIAKHGPCLRPGSQADTTA